MNWGSLFSLRKRDKERERKLCHPVLINICLGDEQCLLYVGPFHVANWFGVEADKLLGTGPIILQIFLLFLGGLCKYCWCQLLWERP